MSAKLCPTAEIRTNTNMELTIPAHTDPLGDASLNSSTLLRKTVFLLVSISNAKYHAKTFLDIAKPIYIATPVCF